MKKMKMKRILASLLFLTLMGNGCMNLFGKYLQVEKRFGKEDLVLPRELIVSNNVIYILDENSELNFGDEKIRYFSLNGKFTGEFGRSGAGPGEFQEGSEFYIFKNKIYILDGMRRQIHIFSENEKKHLESKKIHLGLAGTPDKFLVSSNGTIYFNTGNSIKGDKIITRLSEKPGNELRPDKEFLDCIPVYNDVNELSKMFRKGKDDPDTARKLYLNIGYIATANNKIYFTSWLLNTVYELSMDGAVLKKYTLPIKSIDKTAALIKANENYILDRKLNYKLLSHNDRIFVLSRDQNDDSVVFELINGNFHEKCRVKEKFFSFDISGNKLFGVGRENPEIFIYRLN